MRHLAPTLVMFALTGVATAQTGVLDQANTANNNVGWNMQFFSDMQQVVPVTTTGQLEGFMIRMSTSNPAVGLPVAIFNGFGPFVPSTPPLWSGTAFAPTAGPWVEVFVDLTLAGLYFNAGETITIRVGDGSAGVAGTSLTGNSGWPTAYYSSPFYEGGVAKSLDRLYFETWFLACAGVNQTYGTGCQGTGTHVPKLSMIGCPLPGSQVVLEISQGLGGSTALLLFGLGQGNTPVGGGCSLLVSPLVGPTLAIPLAGTGPGNGSINLPGIIPAGTTGASFTMQAWVIDPTPAPGAAATNGLQVTIG